MMKHLIRITGRHGIVYEERMSEGQIMQFLQLIETKRNLGVAFDQWEITVTQAEEQTPYNKQEREDRVSHSSA